MNRPYEILLCGVGGQGILTVTDVLCEAANNMGLQVRGAETHGMAQRGGSVVAYLRIAKEKVYAPLISERSADIVASFEPVEALRYAKYVRTDGTIITSTRKIVPSSVTIQDTDYPDVSQVLDNVRKFTPNMYSFDATQIAQNLGAAIIQNIVILGALSAVENFPIPKEELIKAIKSSIKKKFIDLNIKALEEGRNLAKSMMT